MRGTIVLKGHLTTDLRILDNGSAETVVKFTSGASDKVNIALIKISKNLYKKYKNRLENKECKHTITGTTRISVNAKGIPYVIIDVVTICKLKNNSSNSNDLIESIEESVEIIEEVQAPTTKWYESYEGQLKEIDVKDIILVEEIHKKGVKKLSGIKESSIPKPMAIRKIEEGKYALVVGLKSYALCKIFNREKAKCFITELSHVDFCTKYNIESEVLRIEKRKCEEAENEYRKNI